MSALDLRRTFVGRSEVSDVSFVHADLSESNFCWNDFISVDFSEATLDEHVLSNLGSLAGPVEVIVGDGDVVAPHEELAASLPAQAIANLALEGAAKGRSAEQVLGALDGLLRRAKALREDVSRFRL